MGRKVPSSNPVVTPSETNQAISSWKVWSVGTSEKWPAAITPVLDSNTAKSVRLRTVLRR